MAPTYPPIMLGTVERVEPLGDEREGVFATIPTIAPGRTMGPLLSSVPGLAKGDSVIIATVGYARDAVQVIARTHSKFPGIDEIPDLRGALDARVRLEDFSDHEARLDEVDGTLSIYADQIATIDRGRDRLRADLQATREALAATRKTLASVSGVASGAASTAGAAATAANLTALTDQVTALRNETRVALYGTTDRTLVPQVELRPTQDIGGLLASTDYTLATLYSVFRDTEAAAGRTAMATIGTSTSNPTRVRIPAPGDYDILYSVRAPQTAGTMALKVMLNADNSLSASGQATNYSVFSDANGGVPEGITVRLRDTGRFDTGDVLTFNVWCSVAFSITSAYFGAVRTRIRVIRRPY